MKNEQVVPNYQIMLETSVTLLALVASGWLLIKLISACFWLPGFLKKWQLEEVMMTNNKIDEKNNEAKETDNISQSEDVTKSAEKEDLGMNPEMEVVDPENKKDK